MKTTMLGQIWFCLFIYGRNNLTGYSFLFYFTLLLESLGEITMGEAFIWYRRRGGADPELLKPTTITVNTNYNAPISGNYTVYSVGGGGGGAGSCRNAWNTSQVFYGPAGTRGMVNQSTVYLNQGDIIQCTIGDGGTGGTNNGTPITWSNGAKNSAGGSGYAGGTTSFGPYASGSGGAGGSYPWYNTYWSNINYGWVNTITSWTWQNTWNNHYYTTGRGNSTYVQVVNTQAQIANNVISYINNASQAKSWGSYCIHIYGLDWQWINMYQFGSLYNAMYISPYNSNRGKAGFTNAFLRQVSTGSELLSGSTPPIMSSGWDVGFEVDLLSQVQVPVWSNRVNWVNKILNSTGRCYTSIQYGGWWYTNNNVIGDLGARTYNGDGGNSGTKGNAGFILIIPPQV